MKLVIFFRTYILGIKVFLLWEGGDRPSPMDSPLHSDHYQDSILQTIPILCQYLAFLVGFTFPLLNVVKPLFLRAPLSLVPSITPSITNSLALSPHF